MTQTKNLVTQIDSVEDVNKLDEEPKNEMNSIQCPAGEHCMKVQRGETCLMWHPPGTKNNNIKRDTKRMKSNLPPSKKYNTRNKDPAPYQLYNKEPWQHSTPNQIPQDKNICEEEKSLEDIFHASDEEDVGVDEETEVFYDSCLNPSEIHDEHLQDKYKTCDEEDTINKKLGSSINYTQTTRKIHNMNCIYGDKNQYLATGLRNTNNSCYLNAVIQCIAKSDTMAETLIKNVSRSQQQSGLIEELRFLIMILRSRKYKSITPLDLRKKVDEELQQFRGRRQHDAHEFLTFLLDKMKTQIYGMNDGKISYEGQYEQVVKCDRCRTPSTKTDVFTSLHLDIALGENPTIEQGIEKLQKDTKLKDYYCDVCKKYGTAKMSINIKEIPDTLILQIKRFEEDKWGLYSKNDTEVMYPLRLQLKEGNKEKIYDLYATINHQGQTTGGHYVAYCKEDNKSDTWYYYNDTEVKEVKATSIKKKDTYVLFYKKANSPETKDKPNSPTVQEQGLPLGGRKGKQSQLQKR